MTKVLPVVVRDFFVSKIYVVKPCIFIFKTDKKRNKKTCFNSSLAGTILRIPQH